MPDRVQTVVITGGASGIGLAITRHFASEGKQIAILDVNPDASAEVLASLKSEFPAAKATFKQCDVASWESQYAAFKEVHSEFGSIDVVVANAGITEKGKIVDFDEETISAPNLATLNINLIGVLYSVRLAAHYMKQNSPDQATSLKGSIICTASNAGLYPFPVAPLYATTKHAVVGLVRSLGRPLQKQNIQINALAPAVLQTNIANDTALWQNMVLTPMSTLVNTVKRLIAEPSLTGSVAEVHGDTMTISLPQPYVDETTGNNIEMFWSFGSA